MRASAAHAKPKRGGYPCKRNPAAFISSAPLATLAGMRVLRYTDPPNGNSSDITRLLGEWAKGNGGALDVLMPLVYAELRRIADGYLRRERTGHTLQPTALVHEAWLRISGQDDLLFEHRTQFYALAAQIMRRILVDHARTVNAEKRGGGALRTLPGRGRRVRTGSDRSVPRPRGGAAATDAAQPPSGAGRRDAILRRAQRRRDGGGARRLRRHHQPRSADGRGVAEPCHGGAPAARTPAFMLTPERWSRLDDLFTAALDLPPAERDAFVAREAGSDPELQAELRGMLAQASAGAGQIDRLIGDVARQAAPAPEWAGRRVGAYRIVREIGRGGMGLVFEAMRDDDEYRKRVALKIAPWWKDVALLNERFRLERQILADLDHPNIARFLDGGTDDGLPYVVMEYVDGVPITEHCAEKRLDLSQRLALFRQVCAAVQFAHQSLVVHRDLKPANILVDEAGVPKLLDFGIAKLLDPLVARRRDDHWRRDVDPRLRQSRTDPRPSDHHPLRRLSARAGALRAADRREGAGRGPVVGAGARSFGVRGGSGPPATLAPRRPFDRLRVVPSRSRDDRAGARRLRGDLDTIVMTALRKEPDRRYESATALSDDLGRHLTGLPVLAQAGTFRYRAGKFLGRHRVAVLVTVLLMGSIAAGLAATLYEARRAERHFQQVRALANTFVFDVHDRVERLPGSTEARQAIVRTALTYLEALRADAGSDDALARELAQAYIKIGSVQGNPLGSNLGDSAGALTSLARADDLLTPLAAGGDPAARRELVTVAYQHRDHPSGRRQSDRRHPGVCPGDGPRRAADCGDPGRPRIAVVARRGPRRAGASRDDPS